MNDEFRDLRDLLDAAARGALPDAALDPAPLVRRVRRSRRARTTAGGVATFALVTAVLTSAVALSTDGRGTPAPQPPAATPSRSAAAPGTTQAADPKAAPGTCRSVIDPAALTGTAGNAAVGVLAGSTRPGMPTLSVSVGGASTTPGAVPVSAGAGVAVLLSGDEVVARAALTQTGTAAAGDGGAPADPQSALDFASSAQLAATSCSTGAALPDGEYRLAAVQEVRTGNVSATALAGGQVVTVRGGVPTTLCGTTLAPDATESDGPLVWAGTGLDLERAVGRSDAARVTGFAASPQIVLVDTEGQVVAVPSRAATELTVHRGDTPTTYFSAAFFRACSGATSVEPATYRVLDVDDEDPWGTAGTTRVVTEIGSVTVPAG